MTNYYIKENNIITQSANWKFLDDCLETEEEIVRYNGQLYLKSDYEALQTTDAYKTEQKKQLVQQATTTRNSKYNNITNSVILDQLAITNLDLELAAGTITQAQHDAQKTIYNNRISAKAALFANATDEFYTVTGLTKPTITQ